MRTGWIGGAWPFWIVLAVGCSEAVAPAGTRAPDQRRREIRSLIRRNLHFNLHAFKRVVDERTGPGVRRHVTEADLPILQSLLDPKIEPEHVIRIGAAATMVQFGEAARPYLTAAGREGSLDVWPYLQELNRKRNGDSADRAER